MKQPIDFNEIIEF